MFDPVTIQDLAAEQDYEMVNHRQKNKVMRLRRDDVSVDIYYSTGTVCVMRKHEKDIFHRGIVSLDEMVEFFANPVAYVKNNE